VARPTVTTASPETFRDSKLVLPKEMEWGLHVYYLYVVRVQHRDKLKEYLKQNGIETGIHYPIPIHLQKFYMERFNFKRGQYPITEQCADEILSLPMFPNLKKEDITIVVETVNKFLSKLN